MVGWYVVCVSASLLRLYADGRGPSKRPVCAQSHPLQRKQTARQVFPKKKLPRTISVRAPPGNLAPPPQLPAPVASPIPRHTGSQPHSRLSSDHSPAGHVSPDVSVDAGAAHLLTRQTGCRHLDRRSSADEPPGGTYRGWGTRRT
jgi:hypothetical protein